MLTTRKKIFFSGIGLLVIIFLFLGLLSYSNIRSFMACKESEKQSRTLIYRIEKLVSSMKDAETGERGFLLTGDWGYLEPYYEGITSIHLSLRKIKEMSRDDDFFQPRLQELEPLIDKRLAQFHNIIKIRKQEGLNQVIRAISTDSGKNVMTEIRQLITEIKVHEVNKLKGFGEESALKSRETIQTLLIGFSFAFMIIFFVVYNLDREMTKRSKANEGLKKAHSELEKRVEARTKKLVKEIGERRQAEKALRASEERLSLFIAQSPMGIVSWDINFRVTTWNHSSEKIFGYSSEEALGQHVEFILPKAGREHIENIWKGLMAMDGGARSTNGNITQNGQEILCDWYNAPLVDSAGKVIGVISLVEDVTERVRMEKELLKVKKLESIGVLAGGIAHDFNNILTAILGNISLTLMDTTLEQKTKRRLGEAEKASLRAKDLTRQLLTFSKGGEPIREATSLDGVIMDSANFVLAGDKSACRFVFPSELWLVDIDKGQISQVMQNLVLNASHSMPDGGIINVTCENVDNMEEAEVPLPDDRKFVKITIEDSGAGMSASLIEKIFDPYFSTKQEGSGLGLAITHSIVIKHGGHISVKSEPGVGTTFTVFLPASSQEERVDSEKEPVVHRDGKLKVMIMDDDEMVRDVAGSMLAVMGYEAVLAKDGLEAVQLYKEAAKSEKSVDVVIMDLTVPGGMGGENAVKELLAFDYEAKVVVASGYSNDSIMASYEDYGFCGSVAKPYEVQELSKVIQTVLQETENETYHSRARTQCC